MCQICSATFLDYQDYILIKSCTIVLSNLFRYFFVYQDHFLIKSCMNILSNLFRYFCDYQDYFLKKIMDDALFFVIKIFFEKIIYYCSIKFVSCMIKYFWQNHAWWFFMSTWNNPIIHIIKFTESEEMVQYCTNYVIPIKNQMLKYINSNPAKTCTPNWHALWQWCLGKKHYHPIVIKKWPSLKSIRYIPHICHFFYTGGIIGN